MRVLFAGTPTSALPSLEAILASQHDVAAVLTRPDAPAGRGRAVVPSPVAERAMAENIEVLRPASVKQAEFQNRVRELEVDCCPVVAYGGLIPRAALEIPRYGWVNLHFSLLPAWRGAAPVQHAIQSGDDVTGASTFQLVEEMDAGPVYGVLTEPIGANDTTGAVLERLAHAGARLLVDTLDGIEAGSLEPRPQPADGVSYASKISVADAEIDWSAPAFAVDRLIRSCTPNPGAWTTFRGARLKVSPLRVCTDADTLEPGELRASRRTVLVGTGSTPVDIDEVQPHGKKVMPAADWARGVRLEPGERLGS